MTMRPYYLLDTNIISEPSRAKPDSSVLEKLKMYATYSAISSITVAEIQKGICTLPDGIKKDRLAIFLNEEILPLYTQIPFDIHAALIYGSCEASLEAIGKPHQFFDMLIASTAIANNMILVTRNTADFTDIPGLMIENWFEPNP